MDDEYEKLIRRMNPPRIVVDNDASEHATVIQVDSANKHGILLEVVQLLTDLNLIIVKAYISSDGGWFMDVFKVTDDDGNKIRDEGIINYIIKSLEVNVCFLPSFRSSVGVMPSKEHTSIELTGTDRPGLLSEVCAVLTDLHCNVVNAEIWTHNARAAAVVHVTDETTRCAIEDPIRLSTIKKLLCYVLKGNNDLQTAKMMVSPPGVTHRERRLHQMMFADRDYEKVERVGLGRTEDKSSRPQVVLFDCFEKDYTVVTMRTKDRPKLLFDTVCTLTDMQYVVFHGTVQTGRMEAYQEYYIRHVDGLPVSSEAERQRVTQCLEAAIERRASEGLELELQTEDRVGLLSDITRIFRENSLCIKRAEISTKYGKAIDTFYVTDVSGNAVDSKTLDSIRSQIGKSILRVKRNLSYTPEPQQETTGGFLFGNLFKAANRQLFGTWHLEPQFRTRSPIVCSWKKPPTGWFKLNSDGSLRGLTGGYGAVIRDDQGDIVAACAGSIAGQTILKHELQGVGAGLQLASSRCNRVADRLASLHPSLEYLEVTPSSFAQDLKDIVHEDKSGKAYLRM